MLSHSLAPLHKTQQGKDRSCKKGFQVQVELDYDDTMAQRQLVELLIKTVQYIT